MTTTIAQLAVEVKADVSDVDAKLAKLSNDLTQAEAGANRTGTSFQTLGRQMEAGATTAASGLNGLSTQAGSAQQQIRGLTDRLQELRSLEATLGPTAGPQIAGAIRETEAEIARLQTLVTQFSGTAQSSNKQASASFLSTVSSVDELRSHLSQLQELQARGRAQGVFTPGLAAEISRTSSALQSLEGNARGFGETVGGLTSRILIHATAYGAIFEGARAVSAVWHDGVQAAIDYQSALLKTQALTVGGAQDTARYSDAIVAMSQHMPATAKELGEGLFFIESHGIRGAAAMDLLKASAQANEAGLGRVSDVARIAAGAVDAYGLQNLSAARSVDILTAGVKQGSLAPDELATSLGKVVGIAAHMGISFEEVIANIATLTRQAVPAAQATTDLSSVMTGLEKPSAQATKALAGIGLSAADLRKSIREDGLLATLEMLEARTGGNAETIQTLLPNVRALRDMYGVTGNQAAAYAEVLKGVKDSQGGTAQSADVMSHSVENQQKVLKNNWDAMIIGLNVLPVMSGAIQNVTERIQAMTEANARGREEQLIGNKIRDDFTNRTGETTSRIINDAKAMGLSFVELNDILAKTKVNPEFLAQMDYLAGRAGAFPNTFGTPGTQAPSSKNRLEADANWRAWNAAQSQSPGFDASKISEAADAMRGLSGAANAVNKALSAVNASEDQSIAGPEFRKHLLEVNEALAAQVESLNRAFDPAQPDKFNERMATLLELRQRYNAAVQDPATREAIAGEIDAYERRIRDEDDADARQRKIDTYNREQAAAAKQQAATARADAQRAAEEAKRAAAAQREALVSGLIGGLEDSRRLIVEGYGRAGDEAINTFISALSGARSGKTTEPILLAQAHLAEQLRTAGVRDWQAAAEYVGQGYIDALAGKLSSGEAASRLQQALADVPRLTLENLAAGLPREAFLSLGGNAGRSLAQGMETGFREGGKKSIDEVSRGLVELLRKTDGLPPEIGKARADQLLGIVAQAIQEDTPEATSKMEELIAGWFQGVSLDKAKAEMAQKLQDGFVDMLNRQVAIRQETQGRLEEIVRGVGDERGVQGLEIFREHQRQLLGEGSEGFRRLSLEIDVLEQKLGDDQGFRAAKENFQRSMDERLDSFREEQYKEQRVFVEGEENKRRELERSRELQDVARSQGRENQNLARGESRQAEDVARGRRREDEAATRQLDKELADARARGAKPEELAQIQSRAADQAAERVRSRAEADEDRNIAHRRALEDQLIKRQQEAADRVLARQRQDQDVAEQRAALERSHQFERQSALALQGEQRRIAAETRAFDDLQEDQRIARQTDRDIRAQDRRIRETEDAYARLERSEQEHLRKVEDEILAPSLNRQLEMIRTFADAARDAYDSIFAPSTPRAPSSEPDESALVGAVAARQQAASAAQAGALSTTSTGQPEPIDLSPETIRAIADAIARRPNVLDAQQLESSLARTRTSDMRGRTI